MLLHPFPKRAPGHEISRHAVHDSLDLGIWHDGAEHLDNILTERMVHRPHGGVSSNQ